MTTQQANERLKSDLQTSHARCRGTDQSHGRAGRGEEYEVRNRLTAALELAKANYQRLGEKASAATKATDDTIREHPYESIGIAFGMGLLLGVLVARK